MSFEIINTEHLEKHRENLVNQWNDPSKPFRYFVFDNFFRSSAIEKILAEYPDVTKGEWNGTTYIHQKNKFTLTAFSSDMSWVKKAFAELNSNDFLLYLGQMTGIHSLLPDTQLFGGGLHQSLTGAFLDVHVDFNIQEHTGYHRRMNAIVYMNADWKESYNGYLELWDMKKKQRIENIAPVLNRLVVFETNEVSYHGHPKPLNTPQGISRKSLAVYYYTKEREKEEIAEKHNTVYINTEGVRGKIKTFFSGVKAYFERLRK